MDQVKSAVSPAGPLAYFQGFAPPADRSTGGVLAPHRRTLVLAGLLALLLAGVTATAPAWLSASVQPSPQPLDGTWSCSLAGEPVGTLSVNGTNYVLGPNDAGDPGAGVLELVVYATKYREEVIKVQNGTLKEKFGVNLGFHYDVPDQPQALVFNIGPGSGIRCIRP